MGLAPVYFGAGGLLVAGFVSALAGSDGRRGCRSIAHALFESSDALLLIRADLRDIGFERLQAMTIFLRLTKHVGHLLFERVETLIETNH